MYLNLYFHLYLSVSPVWMRKQCFIITLLRMDIYFTWIKCYIYNTCRYSLFSNSCIFKHLNVTWYFLKSFIWCFFSDSIGDPSKWGSMRGRTLEARCMNLQMTVRIWWNASVCQIVSPATWWRATGWCSSSQTSEDGCFTSGLESTGISETLKLAICQESAL